MQQNDALSDNKRVKIPSAASSTSGYTRNRVLRDSKMAKPVIRLLVTDLDNTLYDWVGFFANAFDAMVDEAVKILEVDRDRLLDELQAVHRRHHESERPWSLLETPSVAERWPRADLEERKRRLDDAFHAFNRVRRERLRSYPGVPETLSAIHATGVPIVAHTEASAINALTRLGYLELDSCLTRLYAAQTDSSLDRSTLAVPVVEVPRAIHKPDPRILLEICTEFGVPAAETLYVGDSIARDIGMARAAKMHCAWAAYGTRHAPEDWQRLVRVTHWTADDVARAEAAQERFGDSKPDVELQTSYAEILEHFEFRAPQIRARVVSA